MTRLEHAEQIIEAVALLINRSKGHHEGLDWFLTERSPLFECVSAASNYLLRRDRPDLFTGSMNRGEPEPELWSDQPASPPGARPG